MSVKVLHLSSERSWRGGEQQIAYLIDGLKALDVTVFVAVKQGSEFQNYCKRKNLDHHVLPFSNSLDIKSALGVKKLCRQLQPDLVHLHSSKSHGIGVLSALLGNKVPLVLSRRVDFVPKNTWFTRFKYNHASVKRIVCVSHKINEIIREFIDKPEKSVTVHSGIDPEKFSLSKKENILRKEFNINPETFIIGNTSALERHKDYFTFLDTIEILVEKKLPIRAFVIGSGSLESQLKAYAKTKNLTQIVTFTGFRKDITSVLPSLDLFLITSNEEGLGTSVLDAFAAGIPVVGTNAGGIPEMIEDRKTGMLLPVADSHALANAAEEVLKNKALKEHLTKNALVKLRNQFSKEITCEKTFAVYKEILARR